MFVLDTIGTKKIFTIFKPGLYSDCEMLSIEQIVTFFSEF